MEVGAVKQAFNNEVIQLKRNLNQAKIHVIHKLTRKAKTLTGKKAPDELKDKLKRKAESAVNEVLILKKVKPKDIAKFAVSHTGNLQDYLNKPTVDQNKACARLLLHKSLQEKYKFIRNTFTNIPINDLLMSRNERRKTKKEAQEKQKKKRDNKQKVINAEGDWDVEDLKSKKEKSVVDDDISNEDEVMMASDEAKSEEGTDDEGGDADMPQSDAERQSAGSGDEVEAEMETNQESDDEDDVPEDESENDTDVGKFVRPSPVKLDSKLKVAVSNKLGNKTNMLSFEQLGKSKGKAEVKKPSKPKDAHKNKNLNEKLVSRKFKKDAVESKIQEAKIVDPFFITSTGENYMSVVEPRQPDEVKEIHKQGNRKLRRAAMFGHVPKIKPRKIFENNFNRKNGPQGFRNQSRSEDGSSFRRNDSQFDRGNNTQFNRDNQQFKGRNDSNFKGKKDSSFKHRDADAKEPKVEKLHPSWEAKKKKSGILPFQGKKIVFDES